MADTAPNPVNLWTAPEHVVEYLEKHVDAIPHRAEGEAVLVECLPEPIGRVLDLGAGDGRLLEVVKRARPGIEAVAIDFSPAMLERARARFARDAQVTVRAHDLDDALPSSLGLFDAVVSSFAIHHLVHDRKRSLYAEVHDRLRPGGVFANLEHVASPTPALHHEFLATMGIAPEDEDPSNKLVDVETQLGWLRAIGFEDVDCVWKWRELALLVGRTGR